MKRIPIHRVLARARALERRRYSVTVYVPVADNVYYDGYSYRVRVTNDYVRTSRNFKNIKDAIRFRNELQMS